MTGHSHVFPLANDGFSRDDRRDFYRPWVRTVVQCFDDRPVYAGLITGTRYNRARKLLTVNHVPIEALLWRRFLFGVGWYDPQGTIKLTNLSRRGIIRELLRIGFLEPFSPAWPMPVTLPDLEAGDQSRTFYHYDFERVGRLLQFESQDDTGPDWDTYPEFVGNTLRHVARIGTPFLTGPTFDVTLSGDSPVSNYLPEDNGDNQGTGVFNLGFGAEQDMKVGSWALPFNAYGVSRDFTITAKTIDSIPRLNDMAKARAQATSGPRRQSPFTITADPVKGIDPADLHLGSIIRLWSQDDPWEPDGWASYRVLGFNGDMKNRINVSVEVA